MFARAAFTAAISPMKVLPELVGEKTSRFSSPNRPNSRTARSWTGSSRAPTVARQTSISPGSMPYASSASMRIGCRSPAPSNLADGMFMMALLLLFREGPSYDEV